jgi:hypothetical protein
MSKNKALRITTLPQKSLVAPAQKTGKLGKTPALNPYNTQQTYEVDYFRFYESLYRKEITDWQQARMIRRDPFNPLTYMIQQLYKDSMLDNHLSGAIENRLLRVLNKQFFLKDKDGNVDKERSAYIQKKWFKHIVRKALESKFYGYSLVFISDGDQGNIRKVADLPRESVIPERHIILKNYYDPAGDQMNFTDFPNFLIYIQLMPDAIGMLESVSPLTVFKRHSWASWDNFEQIFGIPIRIARTMIDTKKHKDDLQKWLEAMGSNSYGIFDKRVDLEIKESTNRDAFKVFAEKVALINKEISKRILGQTMTMDDGSSQSQANVHLETLEQITSADISDIEDWCNNDFLPVLRAWGYDIPDGYYLDIVANSKVDPSDKIKVDGILLENGYNLDNDYIEQTYEVVLDKNNPKSAVKPAPLNYKPDDFFI